jgi:hypothetical protein
VQSCLFPCPNGEWCCNKYPDCSNNCCASGSFPMRDPVGVPMVTSSSTVSSVVTETVTLGALTPAACTRSEVLKVGAGVGVPLGAGFVGALSAFLYLLLRSKRARKDGESALGLIPSDVTKLGALRPVERGPPIPAELGPPVTAELDSTITSRHTHGNMS